MGYTHYWYRSAKLDAAKFVAFAEDCRKVCTALAIPLGNSMGEGEPVFLPGLVEFNGHVNSGAMMPQTAKVDGLKWPTRKAEGVAGWQSAETEAGNWCAGPTVNTRTLPESGDGSYESFIVEMQPRKCFDCCKTNFHPYDLAVCCCLIALKEHFGAEVAILSDGDAETWKEPADICQHVLGYGLLFELDKREAADALARVWDARDAAAEEAERAAKYADYPPPPSGRDEAIKRIREGLKNRTGRTWSVTGGRGTAWGWIKIDAPPKRRQWHYEIKPGATTSRPEDYEEVHNPAKDYGHIGPEDRRILADALGLDEKAVWNGVSVPAGHDYYAEYVDRAEGREPREEGEPYWD